MADKSVPIQKRIWLRCHKNRCPNARAHSNSPQRHPQPLPKRPLGRPPAHPQQKHQMGNRKRRYNRKLARFRGNPQRHQRARHRRIPRLALARHPKHKVQRRYRKQRLQCIHREEMAKLNMNHRHRRQRRRQQPRPAIKRQRRYPKHRQNSRHIRQRRHRPRHNPNVRASPQQRRANPLHRPQRVQRKTAIIKPARIPPTPLRVQQLPRRRRRNLLHPIQDSPLIRMRRMPKPRIPPQPIQPQPRSRNHNERQQDMPSR